MQLKLIEIDELNSTNDYARELIENSGAENGMIISAAFQSHGKGQSKAVWESEKGKNILMSIILKPEFLMAEKYFFISMIASLGIADCLHTAFGIENVKIKWPNDIYINARKVAGILIQNDLNQHGISSSIIGVGLNVNQMSFSNSLPNPISMQHVLKKEIDLTFVREKLVEFILHKYHLLIEGRFEEIKANYESQLYKYNLSAEFSSQQKCFDGIIRGVDEYGKLVVETHAELKSFDMKEIAYIL
ncbi:MAG: biotin--[acetyl-CoA-carboxylase] ligase [Bacteroidetes bacterium]|nr:biotin--[acetyl-CoA-carboxylase] ligase [Bacteroidota bacterium]